MAQQQRNNDKDNTDLVIGSWNEECEKDNATGFFGGATIGSDPVLDLAQAGLHNMTQPPPRRIHDPNFAGTITFPRGRGDNFRRGGLDHSRGRTATVRSDSYGRLEDMRGGGATKMMRGG